ncbi:MAG: bacteriohopanetetrol glucosamine biosynthesis glycosyltransferase HpnI [Scytolyngbya sp. HA4215-MV1]|nr:bacteriohopanetetrol glucosamine biosynthesis glycosyltransferase HpnI [Scytolyngbya sp. HA4215-MV1]
MNLYSLLTTLITWLGTGHYLTGILFLFCLSAIVYYSLAIYAAMDFFSQSAKITSDFYPPISILKPVCGLDWHAYTNLASFCQQDYPTYQIIFGIQAINDPSIEIVKQLMRDFPNVDIHLVVSDRTIGINRKVCNLANAINEAKHEIVLLADSDIRVKTNYLNQVVQPFHNSAVGVVTCMYRSLTKGRLAAFEAISITTDFLPSVLVAKKLEGMTFALGATIAIRRSVLDEIGGFLAVANYLEDDYQLGNLAAQAGYQVILSDCIVDHIMATESLTDFVNHQTRWARGSRFARPIGYMGLILTYGITSSLLFLLASTDSSLGWLMLSITWFMRLLMGWLIGVKYLRDPVAKRFLWLLPLRDFVSFTLWCYSFFGNTVQWRDQQFILAKGGCLIERELAKPWGEVIG